MYVYKNQTFNEPVYACHIDKICNVTAHFTVWAQKLALIVADSFICVLENLKGGSEGLQIQSL